MKEQKNCKRTKNGVKYCKGKDGRTKFVKGYVNMETTEQKILSYEDIQAMMDRATEKEVAGSKAVMSDVNSKIDKLIAENKPAVHVAEVVTNKPAEVAKMSDFTSWIKDIDWKGIAIGGVISIAETELIDGLLAKQNVYIRAGAKVAGAVVLANFARKMKFLGDGTAKVIVILCVFDAFRDVLPIDTTIKQWTGKITGTITNAGLAGPKGFQSRSMNSKPGDIYTYAQGGRTN
jgi:ElaB/YqjD/DUF883 family membrane-anchored ribosome-binding protein